MSTELFKNWQLINKSLSVLQILGITGGLAYLSRHLFQWIKHNYLSFEERKILQTAKKNEYRVIHKPERSSFPLHIKFDFGVKPFPSENSLEVSKYYEKFRSLIGKGYIVNGSDEIYTLTTKGIKNANRKLPLFF